MRNLAELAKAGTRADGSCAESLIASAIDRLARAGVEHAARDAAVLFEAATGVGRVERLRRPGAAINDEQAVRFGEMVDRRSRFEPVSRIIGWRDFYGRRFRVTPDVLDPRPATETLIDVVLAEHRSGRLARAPRLMDFGTGSGAILLTLLAEMPSARGLGVDVSPAALGVARRNACGLSESIEERAEFVQCDGLSNSLGVFDLFVANPPYIPSGQIAGLAPDVRQYDPHLALDGGADGLAVYRRIAPLLLDSVPNGLIVFEVGIDQAAAVAELFCHAISSDRRGDPWIVLDLAGHQRCVAMRTRAQ